MQYTNSNINATFPSNTIGYYSIKDLFSQVSIN
jgi:hypothetical protein